MTITGERARVQVLITVDGGFGPTGAGDPPVGDNEERSNGGIAFQREALPSAGALHDVLPAVDHVDDGNPLTGALRFTSTKHLVRGRGCDRSR